MTRLFSIVRSHDREVHCRDRNAKKNEERENIEYSLNACLQIQTIIISNKDTMVRSQLLFFLSFQKYALETTDLEISKQHQ